MSIQNRSKPHTASSKKRARAACLPARSSRATNDGTNDKQAQAGSRTAASKTMKPPKDSSESWKMKEDEQDRRLEELTLRAFRIAYENHQRYKN